MPVWSRSGPRRTSGSSWSWAKWKKKKNDHSSQFVTPSSRSRQEHQALCRSRADRSAMQAFAVQTRDPDASASGWFAPARERFCFHRTKRPGLANKNVIGTQSQDCPGGNCLSGWRLVEGTERAGVGRRNSCHRFDRAGNERGLLLADGIVDRARQCPRASQLDRARLHTFFSPGTRC